jgi:nitroimidazol reductase NimA-like FMN-containing flavoprotein (pyridoxamine 5'-phosphate oxidase superfamily)
MSTISGQVTNDTTPAEALPLSPTARSTPGRHGERARTDRSELYALLDEGMICHLAVVLGGAPVVLPTCYGRIGDTLYLHGSTGATSLRGGVRNPVCVTVTMLDALVYARSVFSHSANYRCAVVHGVPEPVTGEAEKLAALRAIVENVTPGSWDHARRPSRKELAATSVLALPLAEASLKVRSGPPGDGDSEDAAGPAWAGVLPVHTTFGPPQPCPQLPAGTETPSHVTARSGQLTPVSGRG